MKLFQDLQLLSATGLQWKTFYCVVIVKLNSAIMQHKELYHIDDIRLPCSKWSCRLEKPLSICKCVRHLCETVLSATHFMLLLRNTPVSEAKILNHHAEMQNHLVNNKCTRIYLLLMVSHKSNSLLLNRQNGGNFADIFHFQISHHQHVV